MGATEGVVTMGVTEEVVMAVLTEVVTEVVDSVVDMEVEKHTVVGMVAPSNTAVCRSEPFLPWQAS